MILVDSNVIIDVSLGDPVWASWSERSLARAADEDEVAINPIIYAEVSVTYPSIEALDEAIGDHGLLRLDLPYEAGFLAGKAFVKYRRRGGARTSPMPDFYIGAHAATAGLTLLTRDPKRYLGYFPSVRLIAPG